MELQWRGKTYTYNSNVIRWREDTRLDTSMPVCGFDTETTRRGGTGDPKKDVKLPDDVTEVQCITFATPARKGIRWIQPGECALSAMIHEILYEVKSEVDHKKTWFIYVHNLGFDTPQLFKTRPDLMTFARTGAYDNAKLKDKPAERKKSQNKTEYFIAKIRNRNCYLRNRALFTGSAPHYTIRCYRTRKDYVDLCLLDSGSYFRGALSSIAKDLKLPILKRERQSDIGLKDYRLVDDTDELKKEFTDYAIDDADIVRMVGEKIFDLHREADFTKIRASSPGFAHSYFTRRLAELNTVIYSGSLKQEDMALVLDSYGGGRTGGIYHGVVTDMKVIDFASSYPASMTSLPSFSPKMKYRRLKGKELKWANVWSWLRDCPHCFLRIDGVETDDKYPSLITMVDGKLTPVYGEFTGIATTGAEVYGGVMSGTLTVTNVIEAVFLLDTEVIESPFAKFANEAYAAKAAAAKGSVSYILAKLLLNSAYGKWIQATKPQLVGSDIDGFVCYFPKGMENEYAKLYLEEYAKAQYEGEDVTAALSDLRTEIVSGAIDMQLQLDKRPFEKMDTTKKEFAPSAIPPAAALVTATSRARLRALIKCTGAIYWDTDSAFIQSKTEDQIRTAMLEGSKWLHPAFVPLRFGEALGEIDLELDGGSGYLAGTKRYFLNVKTADKEKIKAAIHGITNLYGVGTSDRIKRRYTEAVIRRLAIGGTIRYKSKATPLKAKGNADKDVGRFDRHSVAPNFKLDERMNWQRDDDAGGWRGSMKTYKELTGHELPEVQGEKDVC